MSTKPRVTAQQLEQARQSLYHHVDCRHLTGIRISLTEAGRKHKRELSILGISSEEPIRAGLDAVDASPFKTVFVVNEQSGEVLFALSKNDDYVKHAKKKKKPTGPAGPTVPTEPPATECCLLCKALGGTSCDQLSDGSCICFGATRNPTGGSVTDKLSTLGG